MKVLFYAAVVSCIISAFSQKDVEINLIQKFSTNFLKYVQWSKIIILTDDQDFVDLSKHLSQHLISARVAPVNEFDLNELSNFGTVLIISKPNTAIEIVEKALKLSYCPCNWLLILEEKLESFDNFFIPHNIALFQLDVGHYDEVWFLYRLYSATGTVIKAQESGFWDPKNGAIQFSALSVPLPSSIEETLRFSTIEFNPFSTIPEENGQRTLGGLHGEMLKTIQSVFLFNASVIVPHDNLFGAKVNASYASGIVGVVYRNESDVGFSLTMTTERPEFISYSPAVTKILFKIMYHHTGRTEDRFFFYLEPFSSYSWICIIGFTILFAVFSSIICFIKNMAQRWLEKAIRITKIIYYYTRSALQILLFTRIPVRVYGLSGRICLIVFHIFCIIMFISYTSNLTSILAVTRFKLPFNSFHDLLYTSNYELATLKASALVEFFKVSQEDHYVRAYKKILTNPDKLLVKSNKEGMDLIYNRKIAHAMVELALAAVIDKNCSFRFLDEVVMESTLSFTFNKQFPYKQLFNKYIQIFLENGIYSKLYRDVNPFDHNGYCDSMRSVSGTIEMPAVVGLFFTLCLGIGIALIVFAIEILYKTLF